MSTNGTSGGKIINLILQEKSTFTCGIISQGQHKGLDNKKKRLNIDDGEGHLVD
jgi:hypothetical protein